MRCTSPASSTFRLGDPAAALDYMEASLRHGIDTPLYLRNICEVYRTLGRLDEALATAQRATALAPGDPLCLHNQAIIHYHRGELDACLACAERALRIDPGQPGAHFVRAETLLLRGEMAEGWEEDQWRFRISGAAPLMPPTTRPQWDGSPLGDRTLLLVADQGFGDAIQFCRYVSWAEQRCPNIALACSAELAPLLRQVAPRARQFQRWADCPDYAAFAALTGLPRLAGTRLDSVPAPIPYLRADPVRIALWKQRLDALVPAGFRRIGVIWAGRPTHNNDRNRSAGLADFSPIADLPGVALLALQKGPKTGQAGALLGPRAAGQCRGGNPGLRRHDGDPGEHRAPGHGGHFGGASGRRDGPSGVDHAAARTGLALAAGAGGFALVPLGAAVPAKPAAPLGRRGAAHRRGAAGLWQSRDALTNSRAREATRPAAAAAQQRHRPAMAGHRSLLRADPDGVVVDPPLLGRRTEGSDQVEEPAFGIQPTRIAPAGTHHDRSSCLLAVRPLARWSRR